MQQQYYHQQNVSPNPPLLPTPPQYQQYYPATAGTANNYPAGTWNAMLQQQQQQAIQQQYMSQLATGQQLVQLPSTHHQAPPQQQFPSEVADHQLVRRGRGGRGRDVATGGHSSSLTPYWRPHSGRTQEEDLRLSILRFENDLLWSVFVTAASGHADATPSANKPKNAFKRANNTYRPTTITAISPAAPDTYKPPSDPNNLSSSNSTISSTETGINTPDTDFVNSISPSTCSSDYY